MRSDAFEVWGNHTRNDLENTLEELFTENMSDEERDDFFKGSSNGEGGVVFGKLEMAPFNMLWTQIPSYLLPDSFQNAQAVRGFKEQKANKPLTLLSIQFMKTRLFIQEYVSRCYDEDIAATVSKKNGKAATRIKDWVNKGQRKFNTMEERVCKNLWRGFIRTRADDNPYDDVDSVEGCKCKPQEGVKTMECMVKLKDAEKKAYKAAQREAKKKAKQDAIDDAE